MNILLITAYFPPDVGSAAHLYDDLGRALQEAGHQIQVVTTMPGYYPSGDLSSYQGRLWIREKRGGLTVFRVRVPQVAKNTRIGRGLWQFGCAASLSLGSLWAERPDVALVYSPPLPIGLAAVVLQKVSRVPFVLNVQDLFPQQAVDLGQLKPGIVLRFFETVESYLYRRADAITVHSGGNRDHVIGHGGAAATTQVLPNSVDTDQIRPGPKANRLRAELGLTNEFVVSFAGIMGFNQDLDVILDAAEMLRDHRDIRFLLAGDGTERKRHVADATQRGLTNVIWLPMQPRERYPDVLHASDIGLATLRETVLTPVVPSKILSIMAAARPVLCVMSPDGDAPRLVKDADAGMTLSAGRADLLAAAIVDLKKDPERLDRLGRNGRRYVEAHLSRKAMAARYIELFETLTRDRATVRDASPFDAASRADTTA